METSLTICIGFVVLLLLWFVVDAYSIRVYRFHRPGCGYCQRSQKAWDSFSDSCVFKLIKPIEINMDSASKEEQDMFADMGGNGVPHVVLVDNDDRKWVHQGDRTSEAYMKWANNPSVDGFRV